MKVLYRSDSVSEKEKSICTVPLPVVTALGVFDGVHIGHAKLLEIAKRTADENDLSFCVFTFRKCAMKNTRLLIPESERIELLKRAGADIIVSVSIDEVKTKSPEIFVKSVLSDVLNTSIAVCGYDFRFGKDRQGNADVLSELIHTVVVPPVLYNGEPVSSSLIRDFIKNGDIDKASLLLGRGYYLRYPVVHGMHLGRTLGYPTANMLLDPETEFPKFGVYASKTVIDGQVYFSVTDIGIKPTVGSAKIPTAETHIFDFDGDIYGKTVTVFPIEFIREEERFSDIAELKTAIDSDAEKARAVLLARETET